MHTAPTSHHGRLVRLVVALMAAFALMFIPLAAHAEDITGSSGNDSLEGTEDQDEIEGDPDVLAGDSSGGDDNIIGNGGNDVIRGDGLTSNGTLTGGDDTIDGGTGNDGILGDSAVLEGSLVGGGDTISGGEGDDVIHGDGRVISNAPATFAGGNDIINGGAGNDTILGEGTIIDNVTMTGGDDFINGEAGNDTIDGQTGTDSLYGGVGTDTLNGGSGVDFLCGSDTDRQDDGVVDVLTGGLDPDLACPINDEATVNSGEQSMLELAANDDQLTDEADELTPVFYALESVPVGITVIFFDTVTGALTFTATQSGVIDYSVNRTFDDGNSVMSSIAQVFITVLQIEDPDPDDDDDGDDDSDDEDSDDEDSDDEDSDDEDSDDDGAAVLPDTGAADNLQLIGGTGIALTILGMFTVIATPRRRPVTYRA